MRCSGWKFWEVDHPSYDIPLDYGGLNVEGDVATKVMIDFFGHVGDDNQDVEEVHLCF